MIVTTHTADEADTLTAPPHEGGDPWPFVLVHDDENITYADSATELVGVLIPGYDAIPAETGGDIPASDADHDTALGMRYDQAVHTVTVLQESHLAAATNNGDFDPALASEDTLTTMLGGKTVVFTGEQWPEQSVPLYLIATDYVPFTDVPRPAGNVVYLDPSMETAYLISLHEVGLVRFLQHQTA